MPIDLVMEERDGEGKSRTDSIGSDESCDARGNSENNQVNALLMLYACPFNLMSLCHDLKRSFGQLIDRYEDVKPA